MDFHEFSWIFGRPLQILRKWVCGAPPRAQPRPSPDPAQAWPGPREALALKKLTLFLDIFPDFSGVSGGSKMCVSAQTSFKNHTFGAARSDPPCQLWQSSEVSATYLRPICGVSHFQPRGPLEPPISRQGLKTCPPKTKGAARDLTRQGAKARRIYSQASAGAGIIHGYLTRDLRPLTPSQDRSQISLPPTPSRKPKVPPH